MHLYCDHPKHNVLDDGEGFGEFYGARSLTHAREHAQECGWRRRSHLTVKAGIEPTWICPSCTNRPASTEPMSHEPSTTLTGKLHT